MNKAFTKQNVIVLDEKYNLTSDGDSGIVLTFHEPRVKKDREGNDVDYEFEDKWYFTRIVQALRKYRDLSQNQAKSIDDLISKTNKLEVLLERLDKEFRQFE